MSDQPRGEHVIHGYLGIDNDTLWSIIQDDIPGLPPALEKIAQDHR